MIIALGSARPPKVKALEAVLRDLAGEIGGAELRTVDVPSGVRETPLDRTEIMTGARNRVEVLRGLFPDAAYWVGLEGGLHAQRNETAGVWLENWACVAGVWLENWACVAGVWLENWACVSDGRNTYYGCGGSIPLPEAIAREVLGRGRSLADVIDEFSGQRDVRSGEGTWGILTGGRLNREEVFRRALLNAFAPFFNPLFKAM